MALLDQEVLCVIALLAYLLELPQPAEPRGQDAVEEQRDALVPLLAPDEELLPIDLGGGAAQLLLELVVRVPVLEGIAAVVAPEVRRVGDAVEVPREELKGEEVVLRGQKV